MQCIQLKSFIEESKLIIQVLLNCATSYWSFWDIRL